MMNKINKIAHSILLIIFTTLIFVSCDTIEEVPITSGMTSISVTQMPNKTKYLKSDTELDLEGLIVTANYRSGSTKVIPHDELTFKGFKESTGPQAQYETIYVTYGAGTSYARFCTFNITYMDASSLSIVALPKNKYVMNTDSTFDTVGGIGKTGVNRNSAESELDDISNWHFNVDGLKLSIRYLDGTARELTFTNNSDCYGTGETGNEAYVKDSDGKLLYLQRWSEEKDENDQKYKIKIEGFNPIEALTTATNPDATYQVVTISYTENDATVSATANITYTFRTSYKRTPTPTAIELAKSSCYFGDYPQSKKADNVKVCNVKTQNGMYYYQVGSDGNLYCQKDWTDDENYYKVEPIKWLSSGNGIYFSEKVLANGIPYYSGQVNRRNSKNQPFYWTKDGKTMQGTVSYDYAINKYSFIYSTIRNWLNGNNVNGDSTYDGRGFLQTAFTNEEILNTLKFMEIKEYFDANVTVSSNVVDKDDNATSQTTASATDLMYEEKASVKVLIPADFGAAREGKFFYSTVDDKTPLQRITDKAITRTWDKFFYSDNSKFYVASVKGQSDFAYEVFNVWCASDSLTVGYNNCPGLLSANGGESISHTPWEDNRWFDRMGVLPIIKLY